METILTINAQADTFEDELDLVRAHDLRDLRKDLRKVRKSHPRHTWQPGPVPGLDWAGETQDANQEGSR